MAESGKWRRIKEAIDWGRRIQWFYLLLPTGWKAYIVALCLGLVAVLVSRLNRLTPAHWLIVGLIVVAITLIVWSVFEKRKPLPPKLAETSLKQRALDLANGLFEFLQKQEPEPPSPLSVKGSREEQRPAFNTYFGWHGRIYRYYMAYYRDRVVQIDRELAAHDVFTKLDMQEIDPPETKGEVELKKIAEALLLAAHQLPLSKEQNDTQVKTQNLEITLERVLLGTSVSANATVFMRVKLWAAVDLHIKTVSAQIRVEGKIYESKPTDISEWILVEEIIDQNHRRNHRDTRLGQAHSLFNEIESGLFREGHHTPKWIACELPIEFLGKEKSITEVLLTFHDKRGILKSQTFTEWPETSDQIIATEFRSPL